MPVDPLQWPTLSRLLDEALEVPPSARERWLEALRPADASYREELRGLLQHDTGGETRDFHDILPQLPVAEAAATRVAAGPPLAPGATVGPYVIEAEIGRGGMGAVWRARRSDGVLKRPVALKLPHAGLYGRELIERFATERDILAPLAHPNIARLYDAGFSADGQPYLALEYVAGLPLTHYCDQHRLDVPHRLRLFQQVLRAVQYAHGHLVIHRDLKPSNVIVGPDGRAMLLDFGIAKLRAVDAPEEGGHTQLGGGPAALTPDFASPEQITGKPVTTASDIYSLGVLLFELLTGERPYRLQHVSRGALEEAIVVVDPQRPSQSVASEDAARERSTTAKGLSRTLRGDLDTIILKALKKVPAERYATADAFQQDVERHLRGEPVAARPDSGWYRTRKFITRHKLPVAAGGAALAAVLATAAIALWEARVATAERDRALAFSSRSEAVAEFLNVLITESAGSSKPVAVSDMLERSEALVKAEYRDSPEHRAAVLDMLGMHYHTRGEDSRAEPLLQEALDAVQSSRDGDLRRKVTCDHAMSMAALGQIEEASRVLNGVAAEPETTAQQAAECLEYLAYIAQDGSDAANALKFGNLALQRLREVPHPSPTAEGLFLGSLGYAEHLNNRNDAADAFYARSLAVFAKAGRDRGLDAISVRNNWGVVSDGAGNPKRALTLYDQALQIVSENDPSAPPPPYLLANRAWALAQIGRFPESQQVYAQCATQSSKVGTPTMHAHCLLGLASVLHDLGDLASSEGYIRAATEALGDSNLPGSPAVVAIKSMRGKIALTKGEFAAARAELDSAIGESKSISESSAALLTRAELNLEENKLVAAEADAQQALALAQTAQGGFACSNRSGKAWLVLGRVLARQGNTVQARDAFQAAVKNLAGTVDAGHPLLQRARELERGTAAPDRTIAGAS